MKKTNLLLPAAISTLVAIGATGPISEAHASGAKMEKCYGVAKAGKNDCVTTTASCAGTSTEDGDKHTWMLVPKVTCEKLVGGSLTAG